MWQRFFFHLTVLFLAAVYPGLPACSQEAKEGQSESKPPKVNLTISPETTVLTEPLRADGYVDYIAAVNQMCAEGVTPENNAVVLFVQALGPACLARVDPEQFYDLLGIEPVSEDGKFFVPIREYARTRVNDHNEQEEIEAAFAEACRRPWSEEKFPEIARWLRQNMDSLDLFRRGCERPRYYAPLLAEAGRGDKAVCFELLLPTLQETRAAARSLAARAMFRLRKGDAEEAWHDLLACHRLSRLTGEDPTLIGMLVSVSFVNTVCQADAHLLASDAMTAELARSAVADLLALAPLSNSHSRMDKLERFTMLDCISAAASGRVDLAYLNLDAPVVKAARMHTDWDLVLQGGNQWYDKGVAALRHAIYIERAEALDQLYQELDEQSKAIRSGLGQFFMVLGGREAISRRLGDACACTWFPAIQAAHAAECGALTRARLDLIGFALAAFRAEKGAYPDQLARLVPKYLPELPSDPYTGRSFYYRPDKNGFLLYSLGHNMEDNHGQDWDLDHTESTPDQKRNEWDDVRLQIPPQ